MPLDAVATDRKTFPWGVCIGGLVSDGKQTSGNLLLPTSPGGLLILHDQGGANTAANVIETAVLSIVDALKHKGIEMHVIDYSIRKRFPHLAELAAYRQYRVHDSRDSARKALDDVEALARYRHHELLNGETPTLDSYNEASRGFERYRVLVVNLNDFPQEKSEREQFLALCDAASDAGIYVVAYSNADLADATDEKQGKPLPELLAQRYPTLKLTDSGLEVLEHPSVSVLLACLSAQHRTSALPQINLKQILLRRSQLAEAATDKLKDFLVVPIGISPDGRRDIEFRLGALSECNSAFLVGMSGSGKTTLLNHLILGIAERYGSDELRLYLMDYKDGVEFQVFANHPNVEQIFLDNRDIDAATMLLERFVAAIDERGSLFRSAGVKDIDGWNAQIALSASVERQRLPRLMLMVDEAQRLFTDNAAGRKFNTLLKDVVKRGRAFGVHALLATQTLVNLSIDRDLMSQIALRIAFKLNTDDDCARIFNYNNLAPLRLEKFEFIANPDSGYRDANQRGRSLPYLEPKEIASRISAIRQQRPAEQCLSPTIVTSGNSSAVTSTEPSPQLSGFKISETPRQTAGNSWLSGNSANKNAERNRQHETLLAALKDQLADKPAEAPQPTTSPISGS